MTDSINTIQSNKSDVMEFLRVVSLTHPSSLDINQFESIGYYQKINLCDNIYKLLNGRHYIYYQKRLGWIITKELSLDKPDILYYAKTHKYCEPNDSKLLWINNITTHKKSIRIHHVVDLPDYDIPDVTYPEFLEVVREPTSILHTYPGKVSKLLGLYTKLNIIRNGCPVYQHESTMGYLFYCTYYNQNDWRISQSLPAENSRSPARIRCACPKPMSPLSTFLFWEIVDQDDRWASRKQGVVIQWYYKNNKLEPVCAAVLSEFGLDNETCQGWLSDSNNNNNSETTVLSYFRKYFMKNRFPTLTTKKIISKTKKIIFPAYISVNLDNPNVPTIVQTLQGVYEKTDKVLYDAPVYKLVNNPIEYHRIDDDSFISDDDSGFEDRNPTINNINNHHNIDNDDDNDPTWLFFCKKYANHDWRISKQLPQRGDRAPARVRAYCKNVCSPVEDGLFWESINSAGRWDTNIDSFNVTYCNEDPSQESLLQSVLSMLGVPCSDSKNWISFNVDHDVNHMNNSYTQWANILQNHFEKILKKSYYKNTEYSVIN